MVLLFSDIVRIAGVSFALGMIAASVLIVILGSK